MLDLPVLPDPLDINNQAAVEIAATMAVFHDLPDTPLSRWLEYRAYHELVQMLRSANELPANYAVLTLDARPLRDWLMKGKILKRRFSEEAQRLFAQLQAAGGSVINNICHFYCEWKKRGELAMEAANLALHVKAIAAIVATHAGFIFIGGMPLTANYRFPTSRRCFGQGVRLRGRLVPAGRRITTRWTGARIASFSTYFYD